MVSDDARRYLSCTALAANVTHPDSYVEWYWKLGPCILYSVGYTISYVLLLEFLIAQSPDKMKGLVFGVMLACNSILIFTRSFMINLEFTLCFDLPQLFILVVLFVVFLVLSKHYKLRVRIIIVVTGYVHPLLKHWIESVGVFGCRCLKQRQFSKHFELHSSFFHVDQPTLYTQEAYHSHGGITQCILHTFTRSGYAVCNIVRSVRNVPRYGTTPCTTSCIIQYFTSVHVPCT